METEVRLMAGAQAVVKVTAWTSAAACELDRAVLAMARVQLKRVEEAVTAQVRAGATTKIEAVPPEHTAAMEKKVMEQQAMEAADKAAMVARAGKVQGKRMVLATLVAMTKGWRKAQTAAAASYR
mmetsp:Transcript_13845/g.22965  ORF Transcript_13845/g.22965 Transcript_13845/m.22965 type:complete len:125 (-) Transcript_13845:488-862(-)